jgi:SAM-dependent methyltransferase
VSVSSHRQLIRFLDRHLAARSPGTAPLDPGRVEELWTVPGLPRSASYDPAWFMATGMGAPNVLWLTETLSQAMDLHPGMRVLDLGCGTAQSSIFLAREFGTQVWAVDWWIDPSENWARIREAGLDHLVVPLAAEAHTLPFADEFFDAVVSLDAYHYFGTDERYLQTLMPLLRPGGEVGVVVPGNATDPEELPAQLPLPTAARSDFFTFRSAAWWERLWSRSSLVDVEIADMLPDGHGLWVRSLELERAWWGATDELAAADRHLLDSVPGQSLGLTRVVARRPRPGPG